MFYPMLSGGLHTYGTILNLQSDTNAARADAREAQTATELMKHDINRLLMITEALWGFLKKEHGYSVEELIQAINEIDMRDGELGGRPGGSAPVICPACGRANSGKRPLCIYCGQPVPTNPFAR